MTLNDTELESAVKAAHEAYIAAIEQGDDAIATTLWNELERLRAMRTKEQHARALNLAGLTADGTPIERVG